MRYCGYQIVSETIKVPVNVLLTGAGAGKGTITGHFMGRKIGMKKYNKELQKAKLNVNKAQEELKTDPSKLQNVEVAIKHLNDLQTPEAKKKYINRYTRVGEVGGMTSGAATGVLAHKAGSAVYKMLKK